MNKSCPKCGTTLDAFAPQGVCPRCILEASLLDPTSEHQAEGDHLSDPGQTPESLTQTVPVRFGDYFLDEEIAHGGMGVVYRARQISLNRTVAVKMLLLGAFSSEPMKLRFRREATAAAKLQHPNIVAIHEVGEVEGQYFFSMDFIEGQTLAELARESPLPATRAATYARAIAEAIEYAHSRGVLHRDLKPSNILIDIFDQVRITDFGLAKCLEDQEDLTLTGQVMGSPNYLAPELASGGHRKAGPSSDLYAIGAILYELLTGRPPFLAASVPETLLKIRDSEPPALRLLNSAIPPDLETICLKCLEKDPAKRYPTAQALAEDLKQFLQDQPIHARPVSRREKVWRWCRRKPALAASLASLLLVGAIGLAGILWQWRRAEANAKAQQRENYYASIALADHYIRNGRIDQALELLMACPSEYRNWEWGRCLFLCHQDILTVWPQAPFHSPQAGQIDRIKSLAINLTHTRLATLTMHGTAELWDIRAGKQILRRPAKSIAFSPDGTQMAMGGTDGTTSLYDAASAVELISLPGPGEVISLDFSPDGARLVTGHAEGTAKIWACSEGKLLFVLPGKSEARHRPIGADTTESTFPESVEASRQFLTPVTDLKPGFSARYSKDGKLLITRKRDEINVFEAQTGAELFTLPKALFASETSDVDPTGTYCAALIRLREAALSETREVQLWDARTGRVLRRIKSSKPITRFVFSPDGQQMLTIEKDGFVWLWDLAGNAEPLVLNTTANFAAFSPDGRRVATIGFENTAKLWDARTGRERLTLKGHTHYIEQISFSPNSALIATASRDGVVKLWSAVGARERLSGGWVQRGAFSSDGRLMATAHRDKHARVWDADTREELFKLEGHHHIIYSVAFSPDGRRLVTGSVDKTARIWDLTTRSQLFTLTNHSGAVHAVAFNPDGKTIATGSRDQTIKIWDAESGRELFTLGRHDDPIRCIAFSPDGARLVSSSSRRSRFSDARDSAVRVWDLNGRKVLFTLPHAGEVVGLAFSPNGQVLATGGEEREVRLWDMRSGQMLNRFTARAALWELAFLRDGTRLVGLTAGMDFPGRDPGIDLWDVETGREILNLEGDLEGTSCVAASPDGRRLLMGGTGPRVWESFPWSDAEYPGRSDMALSERIQNYARNYWREKLDIISIPIGPALGPFDPNVGYDLAAWPKRDPRTPPHLIDLSNYYNGLPTVPWYPVEGWFFFDNDLSALPRGTVTLENVPFDVRGVIQLRREMKTWRMLPQEVKGISIAHKAQRVHFLHGTVGPEFFEATAEPLKTGTKIGGYVLHYADGSQYELEIVYGRDVRDWWLLFDPSQETDRAELAWTGTNPCTTEAGTSLRLYKRTWENPKPDVEIQSLDFVSMVTPSGPFLIAITIEP